MMELYHYILLNHKKSKENFQKNYLSIHLDKKIYIFEIYFFASFINFLFLSIESIFMSSLSVPKRLDVILTTTKI